ncbi:hypothetical protein AB4391_00880 [Vibrio lentus]|uniref:Uncharacterized protein n=1 Tax=Vibrio lentus TaxID=136468 RepID=A0A2N7JVQ9_9VIBR|nr:hypothetical protein [Vibrio lentus]PMM63744.1 hypothetical protein BCT49_17055 [Vibrio lentus]
MKKTTAAALIITSFATLLILPALVEANEASLDNYLSLEIADLSQVTEIVKGERIEECFKSLEFNYQS